MEKRNGNREGFSTSLVVFLATLSSAVGLGNIWKFPYLVGANGGGAFLITYLICVAFVAIPVMVSEFYIGRSTKKNVMGAINTVKPNKPIWKLIAWFGILAAYFIMFFYSNICGWVYSYVFKALTGTFSGMKADQVKVVFGDTIAASATPILWQIVAVSVVCFVIFLGVKNGIERVAKTLMPILFVLIIICDIRALTLPGAGDGIKFLFHVDFSKITAGVILSALGLAFFKLSLGMGTMVTYSSYFTDDNNMIGNSLKVALSDILVSLLAGLAIFPTVFSFGMKPDAGTGLLFQTIPLVFSQIPVIGTVLLVAFFLLTAFAGTMAMISIVEVPVAFFTEEFKITRKKAVIINFIIIVVIGAVTTLSMDPSTSIGKIQIFGKNFMDFFDYMSSNIFLPVGGLLILILVGYFVAKDKVVDELSNHGSLKNEKVIKVYLFLTRYIAPVLLIVIFLYSLGILQKLIPALK